MSQAGVHYRLARMLADRKPHIGGRVCVIGGVLPVFAQLLHIGDDTVYELVITVGLWMEMEDWSPELLAAWLKERGPALSERGRVWSNQDCHRAAYGQPVEDQ